MIHLTTLEDYSIFAERRRLLADSSLRPERSARILEAAIGQQGDHDAIPQAPAHLLHSHTVHIIHIP